MKVIAPLMALSVLLLMIYINLTGCAPHHLSHVRPLYKCEHLEEYGC